MFLKKLLVIAFFLFLPFISWAQTGTVTPSSSPMLGRLKTIGTGAGYGAATETTAIEIVGMVINAVLALLGTIFIILMLLSGYNWMMARGEEDKLNKAKDTIRAAIIGLIIVIGAFAIWSFISSYLAS